MFEICSYSKCTGCMACMASCPKDAIYEELDDLGFRHPHINNDLCVNCGLCVNICPSNNEPNTEPAIKTYALAAKDGNLLKTTSSGGIATLVSEYIVSSGGIVYGCSGKDIFDIKYIRVSDIFEISCLKGSKYIQARFTNVYSAIKEDLKNGKTVLVIGVSCQLAGLKNFLRREYDNLYLIDIICHGAASQQMVTQNINYYKEKLSIREISDISFRRKNFSNGTHNIRYGFYFKGDGQSFIFDGAEDMFTLGYATNLLFRESCYHCQYAKIERVSDLTLGDFWQLPKDSILSESNGVSVGITHTQKGEMLLKFVNCQIVSEDREIHEAVNGNPQLIKPSSPGSKIIEFRKKYKRSGLIVAIKSIHRHYLLKYRILKIVKRHSVLNNLYTRIRSNGARR